MESVGVVGVVEVGAVVVGVVVVEVEVVVVVFGTLGRVVVVGFGRVVGTGFGRWLMTGLGRGAGLAGLGCGLMGIVGWCGGGAFRMRSTVEVDDRKTTWA